MTRAMREMGRRYGFDLSPRCSRGPFHKRQNVFFDRFLRVEKSVRVLWWSGRTVDGHSRVYGAAMIRDKQGVHFSSKHLEITWRQVVAA